MSAPESSIATKEQDPPPVTPGEIKTEVKEAEVAKTNVENKTEVIENVQVKPEINSLPQETSKSDNKTNQNTNEQVNTEIKSKETCEVKPSEEVKSDIKESEKEKSCEVNKEEAKGGAKTIGEQKPVEVARNENEKGLVNASEDKAEELLKNNNAKAEINTNNGDKIDKVKDGEVKSTTKQDSDLKAHEEKAVQKPLEASSDLQESKLSEEKSLKTINEAKPDINQPGSETLKTSEQEPLKGTVDDNTSAVDVKKEQSEPGKQEKNRLEKKDKPEEVVHNASATNGVPAQQNEVPEQPKNEEREEESLDECVNIQELAEHVMNIINEGVASENSNREELLKKNQELQQFIVKLIHLLKEKTDLCLNLDRQNSALISQAKSLKDVISITKDLLGIRNMEVEHLRADLDSMQESIQAERNRHNTAVQHLTEAMGLNDKLKAEYLTQMDLFEKLKEKYTEKVVVLTRENIRLNALLQQNGIDTSATINESSEQAEANPDPNQPESVDK